MNSALKNSIQVVSLIVLLFLSVGVLVSTVHAGTEEYATSCSGTGLCGATCTNTVSAADNNYSYITFAYLTGTRQWNDAMTIAVSVNGSQYSFQRSDNFGGDFGWTGVACACGSTCGGTDSAGFNPFFSRGTESLPNVISMTIVAIEKQRTVAPAGSVSGSAIFRVSRTVCAAGQRRIANTCVGVTGSLTATPSTCSANCAVTLSWNTNSLGSVKIVRNSSTNLTSTSTPTGTMLDPVVPAGSYTYCLVGYDGYGNETANLQCASVTVTPAYTPPPVCSPTNSTLYAGQPVTLTGTLGDTSFTWSAPGGNPVSGSQIAATSTFTTAYSTIGSKTVTVTDGQGRTAQCFINVSNANPVTVSLSASPTSGAYGMTSTLIWNVANATGCTGSGGGFVGARAWSSGTHSLDITDITATTVFSIGCTNSSTNTSATSTVTVTPGAPTSCTVANFYANQNPIITSDPTGQTTIFTDADCQYDVRQGSTSGSVVVASGPGANTTSVSGITNGTAFYLQRRNDTSSDGTLRSFVVTLSPTPVSNQTCGNATREGTEECDKGSGVNGTCAARCTASCMIYDCAWPPGPLCGNGRIEGAEQCDDGNVSYGNGNGSCALNKSCSDTCTLNSCSFPTVDISATPSSGNWLLFTNMNWRVMNATSCSVVSTDPASDFYGSKSSANGFYTQAITSVTATTTYTMTCFNSANSTNKSDSVTVTPVPYNNLLVTDFRLTDVFGSTLTNFRVGDRVYPSVTITNTGNQPTLAPLYYNTFYKNSTQFIFQYGNTGDIYTTDPTPLNPNESRTYSAISNTNLWSVPYVTYTSTGTFNPKIFNDSTNRIAESDEPSNQVSSAVTIAPSCTPATTGVISAQSTAETNTTFSLTCNYGSNQDYITPPSGCTGAGYVGSAAVFSCVAPGTPQSVVYTCQPSNVSGYTNFCTIPAATSTTVSITAPVVYTYNVTVDPVPTGGKVQTQGEEISCGVTCTRSYTNGEIVLLRAVPSPLWRFVSWTGACLGITSDTCGVLVDGSKTTSALFERRPLIYKDF